MTRYLIFRILLLIFPVNQVCGSHHFNRTALHIDCSIKNVTTLCSSCFHFCWCAESFMYRHRQKFLEDEVWRSEWPQCRLPYLTRWLRKQRLTSTLTVQLKHVSALMWCKYTTVLPKTRLVRSEPTHIAAFIHCPLTHASKSLLTYLMHEAGFFLRS